MCCLIVSRGNFKIAQKLHRYISKWNLGGTTLIMAIAVLLEKYCNMEFAVQTHCSKDEITRGSQ